MKEVNNAMMEKMEKELEKQRKGGNELGEEVQKWTRLLREIKGWKNSQSIWATSI